MSYQVKCSYQSIYARVLDRLAARSLFSLFWGGEYGGRVKAGQRQDKDRAKTGQRQGKDRTKTTYAFFCQCICPSLPHPLHLLSFFSSSSPSLASFHLISIFLRTWHANSPMAQCSFDVAFFLLGRSIKFCSSSHVADNSDRGRWPPSLTPPVNSYISYRTDRLHKQQSSCPTLLPQSRHSLQVALSS